MDFEKTFPAQVVALSATAPIGKGAEMMRFAILLFVGPLLFAFPVLSQQISNDLYVTVGSGVVLEGGGQRLQRGAWYVNPSMWINQWFVDRPFDPTRGRIVNVERDRTAEDPTCTTDITVAINWSTPEWAALGYGERLPPLPGEPPSGIEEDCIVRFTVLDECDIYTR